MVAGETYDLYLGKNEEVLYKKGSKYYLYTGNKEYNGTVSAVYPGAQNAKADGTGADSFGEDQYKSGANSLKSESPDYIQGETKLTNGINAYVGAADIEAGQDINIKANDTLSSLMIAGTVAIGGGAAGVSVGVSVGVMNSNVASQVAEGANLNAGNGLNGNKDAEKAIAKANTQNGTTGDDPSAVRMIGVVLAGGLYAGVGVGLGTLVVTSDVKSVVAGNVESANKLTVEGKMNFDNVLTTVVSAGVGAAGVGVSVAGAWFEGKVTTGIAGAAKIGQETGKTVDSIEVKSSGTTTTTAATASVAGGVAGVAVNGAEYLHRQGRFRRHLYRQGRPCEDHW